MVPAASYVIAMANKPKAQSLASKLPGETMIGKRESRRAHASKDVTDVHWSAQAEAKEPRPAKSQALASRKHKFAGRSQNRKERIAHAGKDALRAEHTHRHKRTHPGADGQHKKRAAQRMMRISMDFQVDR